MRAAEVLGDLGGVPVHSPDAVGAGVAHHLAAEQVRLGGLAGARRAARGDHADVRLDESGGEGRGDGEGGDRRVAAGHGDPSGAAQQLALAGQLGQAVGPGAGVGAAVELLPRRGVGEPEVGAAVDDDHVVAERLRDRGRLAVGQPEDDDVVPGQRLDGGRLEHPVGEGHEVRLQGAERLPGVGARGEGADPGVGVAQEQAQHLAPGVPAGTGDGDGEGHVHEYTCDCMLMPH